MLDSNGYVLLYVEGKGYLAKWFSPPRVTLVTQDEIEQNKEDYLFVRDKKGELDLSIEANGLPVYREEGGQLTLVSEGRTRIVDIFYGVSAGSSLKYLVIDSCGKSHTKALSFDEIAMGDYFIMPFIGEYRAILEKVAERKRVMLENPSYFKDEARSQFTGQDCAVYSDESSGTEYVTVVRSFNHCGSGVCKLSSRVNHVLIELESLKSSGVRVLDLSECSCLTRFSLTNLRGVMSEAPITIIFNEKYHSKLDARLCFKSANIKFVGLSSVSEVEIKNSYVEGISELRVISTYWVCGTVSISDSKGFNSLKIVLEDKEARVAISGIDAREIEIIGNGQGIGKDYVTAFSVTNCRELTRLTVRGVGVCTLKGLKKSFFNLPKMVSFSLFSHMLQFMVDGSDKHNVFSLTLGSISLRELILSAEYTTLGAKWLKVGYDKRVKLSIPTELREFVVPMNLTDECLNLLALTSSYKGLFMDGDKLTLDLGNVENYGFYPIFVRSGGKVSLRVPSCIDRVVDTCGNLHDFNFRLIVHKGTEVADSVKGAVVRCE